MKFWFIRLQNKYEDIFMASIHEFSNSQNKTILSTGERVIVTYTSDNQENEACTELAQKSTENSQIILTTKKIRSVIGEESNLLGQWMESVYPLLKPGSKSVAIILALGAIAIPLASIVNTWVAGILAAGAVTVAVIVVWRSRDI
jgi:hypothetical protein